MIGETLEDADDILGAVVSIKRGQDRLALWTKTASDEVRACVRSSLIDSVRHRSVDWLLFCLVHTTQPTD